MTNALTISGLTKAYKDYVLDHVSFTVPSGSIVGLIGENGAGKSTTIHAVLGLIQRDEGHVSILGSQELDSATKEQVGVVFDGSNYPETFSPGKLNRVMKNIYRSWDEEAYFRLLKDFSLPRDKQIKHFSRGMKMKLAISVAFSHHSRLLILDEATSGLDPVIRNEILDIFREFIEDGEHTIFLSSHITSDIEKIADYVMLIHKGRLLFTENKDELLYRYGIVKCSRKQADFIPRELIVGEEENEFGVSVLISDRTRLMESSFPRQAEKVGDSSFALDRAGVEDVLLYAVKSAEK